MPDVLDTLEWKPWPKDPNWAYADISGVARIGRKTSQALNEIRYSVRALDDEGKFGNWQYTNIERAEAARILDDAIRACQLEAAL